MNRYWRSTPIVLAAALAGCGGGGGVNSFAMPTPTPTPTPSPAGFPSIVATATTSQQLSVRGASYETPQASYDHLVVGKPILADTAQMDVRYDAVSKTYQIELPGESAWQPISSQAKWDDQTFLYRGGAPDYVGVVDHRSDLQYSGLLEWFTDASSGYSAIGVATLPGNVPITGSASYSGTILGASSETYFDKWEALWSPMTITGAIDLSFNFGNGTLSGSINPHALPSLNFTNTVYSTGSTTFSGAFGTALPGQNSFSGLFTGPNAQELIGNFAFPYASPTDGTTQQAGGAFVGRRP